MYIEFSLPTGSSWETSSGHANEIISKELRAWADKYQIVYHTKIIKYTKRVTFAEDAHYAFFALTWNSDRKFYELSRWRMVSDLNNKTVFDSIV